MIFLGSAWVCLGLPGFAHVSVFGTGRDPRERHLTAIGIEIDRFAGGYGNYMNI